LPTLEIADRMIEQAPGITRMIDRLIAKQLVIRERCAEDRRVVYCAITEEGRRMLTRLDDPVQQADRAALDALTDEDLRKLITLLDAVRAEHEASARHQLSRSP
jgi:DNA-binding MarR family transcriptional regulator